MISNFNKETSSYHLHSFVDQYKKMCENFDIHIQTSGASNSDYLAISNFFKTELKNLASFVFENKTIDLTNFYKKFTQDPQLMQKFIELLDNNKTGISPEVKEFLAYVFANGGKVAVDSLLGVDVAHLHTLAEFFANPIFSAFDCSVYDQPENLSKEIVDLRKQLKAIDQTESPNWRLKSLLPINSLPDNQLEIRPVSSDPSDLKPYKAIGLYSGLKSIFLNAGIIQQIVIVAGVGGILWIGVKTGISLHNEIKISVEILEGIKSQGDNVKGISSAITSLSGNVTEISASNKEIVKILSDMSVSKTLQECLKDFYAFSAENKYMISGMYGMKKFAELVIEYKKKK